MEINKLTEGICLNNLTHRYKDKSAPNSFIHFKGLLIIYNDITNGQISLQKEEKIQEVFKLELNEILKGDPDYKLEDQINVTKIWKSYTMTGKKLLNFIMIMLECDLRLNSNQFMEMG